MIPRPDVQHNLRRPFPCRFACAPPGRGSAQIGKPRVRSTERSPRHKPFTREGHERFGMTALALKTREPRAQMPQSRNPRNPRSRKAGTPAGSARPHRRRSSRTSRGRSCRCRRAIPASSRLDSQAIPRREAAVPVDAGARRQRAPSASMTDGRILRRRLVLDRRLCYAPAVTDTPAVRRVTVMSIRPRCATSSTIHPARPWRSSTAAPPARFRRDEARSTAMSDLPRIDGAAMRPPL